jgi:hypothetical protein
MAGLICGAVCQADRRTVLRLAGAMVVVCIIATAFTAALSGAACLALIVYAVATGSGNARLVLMVLIGGGCWWFVWRVIRLFSLDWKERRAVNPWA